MTTCFITNVNYMILLAKWYIHRQVYLKQNIDFFNFLIVLQSHLDTEQYICICNGRLHTFNIQWSEIYECLQLAPFQLTSHFFV